MSFIAVAAIGAGVGGAAKIAGGLIGGRKRRREQAAAERELATMKSRFETMDTSNPYANLENTMEDLTVNTQQADFMAQQAQQNQANIMQNMQGAAGGSGIAALAQAMANQGTQQAQQASASIGQQEAANNMAMAKNAQMLINQEAQGAARSQDMEMNKISTQMGMAQERLGAANAAREAAKQQVIGGIGDVGGAVQGYAGDMITAAGGLGNF
mgnify:FL=1